MFIEPQYLVRFRLSAFGASSSVLLFVATAADNLTLWSYLRASWQANIYLSLTAIQLIAALGLALTYGAVPRRPDVYRDEKVVDKQFTVSILGRLGFSWPDPLLRFAATNNGLDIDHLPEIDYQTRAKTLWQSFERAGKKDKLWKSLFWSHKWAFLSQWTFVTITSATNFLPQIA